MQNAENIKKIASAVTAAMMLSAMASAVPAGAAETDVILMMNVKILSLTDLMSGLLFMTSSSRDTRVKDSFT